MEVVELGQDRNRVDIEVEATGGTRVGVGDPVTRGQDLGMAPDFAGRVLSPVDGVVETIGFNPGTHRFEISIRVAGEDAREHAREH